jgi:hypothetical protein
VGPDVAAQRSSKVEEKLFPQGRRPFRNPGAVSRSVRSGEPPADVSNWWTAAGVWFPRALRRPPRLVAAGAGRPEEVGPDTFLEDEYEHAVGGADAARPGPIAIAPSEGGGYP